MATIIDITTRFNGISSAMKRRSDFFSSGGRARRKLTMSERDELFQLNSAIAYGTPRNANEVRMLFQLSDELLSQLTSEDKFHRRMVDDLLLWSAARKSANAFIDAANADSTQGSEDRESARVCAIVGSGSVSAFSEG